MKTANISLDLHTNLFEQNKCLASSTQWEKLVPYIPSNVYGGNRLSPRPMPRQMYTSLVLDLMFIDSRLQVMVTSLQDLNTWNTFPGSE